MAAIFAIVDFWVRSFILMIYQLFACRQQEKKWMYISIIQFLLAGGLSTSGILRQRTRSRTTSCNSQWEEIPPKKTDCGSQTDKEVMSLRGYCLEKEDDKPPRSIDECLLVMNSEV